MLIQSFSVKGFLGKKDVHITFNDLLKLENGEEKQVKILVGENGIGKTQLLNMFYYTLTQDFFKLAEFEFERVELILNNNEKITKTKKDIVASIIKLYKNTQFSKFVQEFGYTQWILLLEDARKNYPNHILMKKYLKKYNMDASSYHFLRNFIQKIKNDKISFEKDNFDNNITIIYLPTYRRVEEDLYKLKGYTEDTNDFDSDLDVESMPTIQFGMNDVQNKFEQVQEKITRIIKEGMADLIPNLLTLALETSTTDNQDEIWQTVTARDMEIILARVDSSLQKNQITALEKAFVDKKLPNPLLGHILKNLIEIYKVQRPFDDAIKSFQSVCNKYLIDKEVYYDERFVDIYLRFKDESNSRIELSKLSSGEKQIISIFAKLYLSLSDKPYLLLFDEPELSLSLEWQAQLLPDIMDSGKCGFLLAVTHSPFIFDNKLDKYAASLSTYMKPINRIN
jgi:ABC-type transport system involved in cytochrome c biogenesis ATPase subunit